MALPTDAAAQARPRAVIAILPAETSLEQLAQLPDLAPGLVSGGLGEVPVAQTYLDVSQGNRVDEDLYDSELPDLRVRDGRVPPPLWERTVDRATGAPGEVVPGLLGSTLAAAEIPVIAAADLGPPSLIAVDRAGAVATAPRSACERGCGAGLSVIAAGVDELPEIVERLRESELLIAVAAPRPAAEQLLAAGVAGPGFDGNLTSDSTRTAGLVTSTDLAPTVLDHLGVEVPTEMNGSEIEVTGDVDVAAVVDLRAKLVDRPSRDLVVFAPLVAWLLAAGALALGGHARTGLTLLALACAWAPTVLLAMAELDAPDEVLALVNAVGSMALAVATRALAPGYLGLAIASAITVSAYAVDVLAGSPLTASSVLGPNPGGGVRFFGIGNELEAVVATLTLIGTGSWLATRRDLQPRQAAAWFAAIALIAAAIFAAGRFGADVGAAIVLAAGAATAASFALGLSGRRTAVLVAVAGLLGVAALIAIDSLLGGAHLSRSVLGADEATDVVDVIDRRLALMVNTFVHPPYPWLLGICTVLLAVGVWRRRQVLAWFGDSGPARCGFAGAVAGVLVGTVANDSGSVLLVIGTIYLAVCSGFAWATPADGSRHAAAPPRA